jgi:hypothetical protein
MQVFPITTVQQWLLLMGMCGCNKSHLSHTRARESLGKTWTQDVSCVAVISKRQSFSRDLPVLGSQCFDSRHKGRPGGFRRGPKTRLNAVSLPRNATNDAF